MLNAIVSDPGLRKGSEIENDYVTNEKLEATKVELLERIEKAETNLLTEFRKWARSFESRTRVTEFTVSALHERMGLIEDRVSELENPSPS